MTWSMTAVPVDGVKDLWLTVSPLISSAVVGSKGRVTLATLLAGLLDERYVLWVVYPEDKRIRAAFVTRIAQYPAKRILAVDFAGGSRMRDWIKMVQSTFRAYAVDAGCEGVEMAGRKGWVRELGRYGWDNSFVVMTVDAVAGGENFQGRG